MIYIRELYTIVNITMYTIITVIIKLLEVLFNV